MQSTTTWTTTYDTYSIKKAAQDCRDNNKLMYENEVSYSHQPETTQGIKKASRKSTDEIIAGLNKAVEGIHLDMHENNYDEPKIIPTIRKFLKEKTPGHYEIPIVSAVTTESKKEVKSSENIYKERADTRPFPSTKANKEKELPFKDLTPEECAAFI